MLSFFYKVKIKSLTKIKLTPKNVMIRDFVKCEDILCVCTLFSLY